MEIKIDITCSCGNKSMVQLFSDQQEYSCEACGAELFKAHISNGYVYVLSNPSMPNLLKIGYTERDVDERVEELNSTGVPVPFEVEAIFGSPNAYEDEQAIHDILDQHRLANNREFFSIGIKEAIQCIIDHLGADPSFLNSPELLMDEQEKATYFEQLKANQLEEITRLESLRDKYLDMIPSAEKIRWRQQADDSYIDARPHLSEEQEMVIYRFMENALMPEHLYSKQGEKDEMAEWLENLELLREQYYGYDYVVKLIES